MDADRWRRVKEVCQETAARDAAERVAFLDDACAGDDELRREVEALLATESEAEGFLASAAWRLPTLAPGTRLGPHEILELVGAGGMGEVYKARDTRLDRIVALKVLPPQVSSDPERRSRFAREAKTVSQLNHPHICVLHDIGEAPAPGPPPHGVGAGFSRPDLQYLVMEFLEGETLATRLAKGPLPLAQALAVGAQVADALAAAHKHGVVHRDLKPGNVMLTKSGAKLLDFGLAKLRAHGERPVVESATAAPTESEPLTGRGVIVGTLPYMAPEQLEGKPADARTDLWALGTILYEMLAGRRAFEGDSSASLIGAILEHEPEPIAVRQPLTPPGLDRLVRKCLAKAPDDRWDSAHDVADELRWIQEAGGIPVVPETPAAQAGRRRIVLPVAGVVLGAIVGAALMWALRAPPSVPLAHPSLDVRPADELNAGGATNWVYTRGGSRTALTWTPDGQALIFVGRRDGVQQLYVRHLHEAQARPLAGTEGAQVPAVSADGRWVAFWAGGIIKKIPTGEGPVTDLAFDVALPPFGMVWGDRGSLFFGSFRGIQRIIPEGEVAAVTTRAEDEVLHSLPWVLPDERVLLYTVRRREWSWGDDEVVAQTLRTGERKVILEDAVDARFVAPDHLVFMRRGQLFLVGFDANRAEPQGAPVALLDEVAQSLTAGNTDDITGAGQFAILGTKRLAWVAAPPPEYPPAALVTVDRSGGVESLPAPERPYGSAVRLSRDGRWLAVTTQTVTEGRLWVYDLDRGRFSVPLPGEGERVWPLWSRDGRYLFFDWLQHGQRWLAGQPADGTAPPRRILAGSFIPSAWAPDGDRIVSVRGGHIEIVHFQDGEGTSQRYPFTFTGNREDHPELSPDGRWLAYVSDDSGRFEVYVRPYAGPGPAEVVSTDGGNNPAWNPNGREIFYTRPPGEINKQLVAVAFDPDSRPRSGNAVVLFPFSGADLSFSCAPVRCYDVAPDGERFYAVLAKLPPTPPAVTHISLIENWLEELTAKVGGGR